MQPRAALSRTTLHSCALRAVLCALLLPPSVVSKTIEVPLASIKAAKDVANLLGAPPSPDEPPPGFAWGGYGGAVNVTTNVLFPLEGQTVPPDFEVMLEVAAHPLGAFQARWERGFACVELDGAPPACWPVRDQTLPRFSGLPAGSHALRSCVTDPRGERPLHTSWSALRTFNVAAAPDGSAASDSTEVSNGSEPPPDEGAPVQMEPPLVRLLSPPEMSVLTTAFVDVAYEVATRDPPLFEQHFGRAYACASLDDSEACACWPLFNVSRSPRWVSVAEGFHTARAFVTHPNTGAAIAASWSRERCFVVYTAGDYHARALKTPLLGSPTTLTAAGATGASTGGAAGGALQLPFALHVVVSLDLNGHQGLGPLQTHNLPVQRLGDAHYEKVAGRFCDARGVGNPGCVGHIVAEVHRLFDDADAAVTAARAELAARASDLEARAAADAEARKRRVPVPEGSRELAVPRLTDAAADGAVGAALFAAVATCAAEHASGGVGLACLTAQSGLFGMREDAELASNPAAQEELLDFIGNLGAGFGF